MNSGPTQMAENRGVDELLKETEVGQVIAENKKLVISLVVLILLGVIGWGVYSSKQKSSYDAQATKLYQFSSTTYKDWLAEKVKTPEMISLYRKVSSEVASFPGLFPFALEMSDQLIEKGMFNDAKEVLASLKVEGELQKIFLSFRNAVVYEELGEYDQAIKTLESVLGSKLKLMESRVYLDLGRYYLKADNKEKARQNFEHVISTFERTEESKLAKLYLSQM